MSEKPKKIEIPKNMASAQDLFMRILDKQDDLDKKISDISTKLATLEQAFKDYCTSNEKIERKVDVVKSSNKKDWAMAAGWIITIGLFLATVILDHLVGV